MENYKLSDGSIYSGEILNGIPEGNGVNRKTNGNVLETIRLNGDKAGFCKVL